MARERTQQTLVIGDGGLSSLVACLIQPDPTTVVAWVPPGGSACLDAPGAMIGAGNRRAMETQADLLALRGVESAPALHWGADGGASGIGTPGLPTDAMLLLALDAAARLECDVVLWPVACGDDLDHLAGAAERGLLLSRLRELADPARSERSRPAERVSLRTPLADLTPSQVAELALDLDAPLRTCWWAEAGPSWEAPAIDARLKWDGLLEKAAAARGDAWARPGVAPVSPPAGPRRRA